MNDDKLKIRCEIDSWSDIPLQFCDDEDGEVFFGPVSEKEATRHERFRHHRRTVVFSPSFRTNRKLMRYTLDTFTSLDLSNCGDETHQVFESPLAKEKKGSRSSQPKSSHGSVTSISEEPCIEALKTLSHLSIYDSKSDESKNENVISPGSKRKSTEMENPEAPSFFMPWASEVKIPSTSAGRESEEGITDVRLDFDSTVVKKETVEREESDQQNVKMVCSDNIGQMGDSSDCEIMVTEMFQPVIKSEPIDSESGTDSPTGFFGSNNRKTDSLVSEIFSYPPKWDQGSDTDRTETPQFEFPSASEYREADSTENDLEQCDTDTEKDVQECGSDSDSEVHFKFSSASVSENVAGKQREPYLSIGGNDTRFYSCSELTPTVVSVHSDSEQEADESVFIGSVESPQMRSLIEQQSSLGICDSLKPNPETIVGLPKQESATSLHFCSCPVKCSPGGRCKRVSSSSTTGDEISDTSYQSSSDNLESSVYSDFSDIENNLEVRNSLGSLSSRSTCRQSLETALRQMSLDNMMNVYLDESLESGSFSEVDDDVNDQLSSQGCSVLSTPSTITNRTSFASTKSDTAVKVLTNEDVVKANAQPNKSTSTRSLLSSFLAARTPVKRKREEDVQAVEKSIISEPLKDIKQEPVAIYREDEMIQHIKEETLTPSFIKPVNIKQEPVSLELKMEHKTRNNEKNEITMEPVGEDIPEDIVDAVNSACRMSFDDEVRGQDSNMEKSFHVLTLELETGYKSKSKRKMSFVVKGDALREEVEEKKKLLNHLQMRMKSMIPHLKKLHLETLTELPQTVHAVQLNESAIQEMASKHSGFKSGLAAPVIVKHLREKGVKKSETTPNSAAKVIRHVTGKEVAAMKSEHAADRSKSPSRTPGTTCPPSKYHHHCGASHEFSPKIKLSPHKGHNHPMPSPRRAQFNTNNVLVQSSTSNKTVPGSPAIVFTPKRTQTLGIKPEERTPTKPTRELPHISSTGKENFKTPIRRTPNKDGFKTPSSAVRRLKRDTPK